MKKIILLYFINNINGYTLLKFPFIKTKQLNIPNIVSIEKNDFNNQTYNSTYDYDFPSFNKFLEKKTKKEEALIKYYFEKAHKKAEIIEKELNNPLPKNLKLLTYQDTLGWGKEWIDNMIKYGPSDTYPKFIYDNIYDMRKFCKKNITKEYFFIAYSFNKPEYGPYYIAAFKLIKKTREFDTYLIMQNPNYIELHNNNNIFIDFKLELLKMSKLANVSFKYDKLNNLSTNRRYYLTWFFEYNN